MVVRTNSSVLTAHLAIACRICGLSLPGNIIVEAAEELIDATRPLVDSHSQHVGALGRACDTTVCMGGVSGGNRHFQRRICCHIALLVAIERLLCLPMGAPPRYVATERQALRLSATVYLKLCCTSRIGMAMSTAVSTPRVSTLYLLALEMALETLHQDPTFGDMVQ